MSADLAARGLVVRRGTFTLGPIDLEVAPGEYLVLVGPSGAGKTVLVETLLGWHRPAEGDALLEGAPVASVPPARRRLAYLPQDLGILPHLSVRANLAWGLDCRGESADPALEDRVVRVLNLAPLLARRDPATLSRGEQQRVALGRALLTQPRRLVLDEPCAAVDPHRRRELQLLLRALHREFGTTVVHVTHDREEAFLLGQRIAVLLAGKLHQVATPAALYDRPADLAVARFVAPENLWACTVSAGANGAATVRLVDAPIELAFDGTIPPPPAAPQSSIFNLQSSITPSRPADPGTPLLSTFDLQPSTAFVGIRPEEVVLLDPDRPLRPQVARNVLAATLAEVLLLDGRAQLVARTDAGLDVTVRAPICTVQDHALTEGSPVRVCLKARSLYLVG